MRSILGHAVSKLFDPVQTHVIHGLRTSEVEAVKAQLKLQGAVRFRKVKNRMLEDTVSLCFKIK